MLLAAACTSGPPPRAEVPPSIREPAVSPVLEDRSRAPRSAPEESYVPPKVFERRLANGVRVLVVERRELPLVHLSLVVRRGAVDAPPGIVKGAVTTIADEAPPLPNVRFRTWVNYDAIGVSAVGLTFPHFSSNLPTETFAGFAELLRGASAVQAPFVAGCIRHFDAARGAAQSDAASLARLERASLYPAGHPYRYPLDGTTATPPDAAEAAARFWREHVQPDQLVAVAAGDVARESFVDSIDLAFSRWQGRAVPRAPLPEPIAAPLEGAPVTLLDRPGLQTSRILMAARAVSSVDRDYHPLRILSTILGGTFVGRLSQNLRETNAFSYASASDLGIWRGTAPFEARALAAPERTADAVREMTLEIERLRNEELSAAEFERVRRAAIRRIPMLFADLASTVEAVSLIGTYDLPADEYSRMAAALERVTAADVTRVAKVYLAPERLRWFILGDASVVRKPLEALPFGPLAVVKAESGEPGTLRQ
jgi:predicted Zn-dependent peptidase